MLEVTFAVADQGIERAVAEVVGGRRVLYAVDSTREAVDLFRTAQVLLERSGSLASSSASRRGLRSISGAVSADSFYLCGNRSILDTLKHGLHAALRGRRTPRVTSWCERKSMPEFVDPPFIQFLNARLSEEPDSPAKLGIQSAIGDYLEMHHFVDCDPEEWPDNHHRLKGMGETLQYVAGAWFQHPDYRLMVTFNGDRDAMKKEDAEVKRFRNRPYGELQDWERELFTRDEWEATK